MNPHLHDSLARALAPIEGTVRLDAAGIYDALGVAICPGSMLIGRDGIGRLVVHAIGSPAEIDRHPLSPASPRLDRRDSIVIPGLVNAHAHLDLTHLGPRPYDAARGFTGWIDDIRLGRLVNPGEIEASVQRGIELSLQAGVVAVGDIAGGIRGTPSLIPARALADSPMFGTSFLEFFGLGPRPGEPPPQERLLAFLDTNKEAMAAINARRISIGLQPHAPYSVSLSLYTWAAKHGPGQFMPVCTHLAETLEEREFIAHARGPLRTMLERFGVWHDGLLADLGHGEHPVRYLRQVLARHVAACAHVNDADDEAIRIFRRNRAAVVYCPRAHEYFGHARTLGPHRYRDMIAETVHVALGTDSIVNLPPGVEHENGPGLSIWDEMRLLHRRDGTHPEALLSMATAHGLRALGYDPDSVGDVSLDSHGTPLGILAVKIPGGPPMPPPANPWDLVARVLDAPTRPEIVLLRGKEPRPSTTTPRP